MQMDKDLMKCHTHSDHGAHPAVDNFTQMIKTSTCKIFLFLCVICHNADFCVWHLQMLQMRFVGLKTMFHAGDFVAQNLTNDISSRSNRQTTRDECSKDCLKKKLSYSNVSPLEQLPLHANLKVISIKLPCVWSNTSTRSTSSLARLLARCACFVMARCFCYHMPVGCRNRTWRGNSLIPFHFVFRIWHCVFSSRAHISCWSRTRDATSIRALNHGWNRTIVKLFQSVSNNTQIW